MPEAKQTRPDLSWITSQKFNSVFEYNEWYFNLPTEKRAIVFTLNQVNLPNLITCTEMLFDSNVGNPESLVFKIASETLNI